MQELIASEGRCLTGDDKAEERAEWIHDYCHKIAHTNQWGGEVELVVWCKLNQIPYNIWSMTTPDALTTAEKAIPRKRLQATLRERWYAYVPVLSTHRRVSIYSDRLPLHVLLANDHYSLLLLPDAQCAIEDVLGAPNIFFERPGVQRLTDFVGPGSNVFRTIEDRWFAQR